MSSAADDPTQLLAARFARAIERAFGPEHAGCDPLIRPSTQAKFGDFQANIAMSLGKALQRKPREVAEAIVAAIDVDDLCSNVEIAGPGFINLTLSLDHLQRTAASLQADERLGAAATDRPSRVVVDYSGANAAKQMHVGHLRSTVIGDALVRVLGFRGDEVIRQNHLGDWGTQFGMLAEYLLEEGLDPTDSRDVGDLNSFYQAAKKRFDESADFADRARKRVVKLQGGDGPTLAAWRSLIDASLMHMNAVYRRLDVSLGDDDVRGESAYNDRLAPTVAELEEAGLAHPSRGATVVYPEGFADAEGQPLAMIVRKADGGYLYATTDLAAVRFRVKELEAERVIYVTDARQADHFAKIFAVARAAGWAPASVRLDHVAFGTILGSDRRPFKTREGEAVPLLELLEEAVRRARAIITQKSPHLDAAEADAVAEAVGVGAVKYADLSNDRVKDYVFDWDRMLAFEGNTGPYLQNAYVRIRSIFRKGEVDPATLKGEPITPSEPAERALLLKLLQLRGVVESTADSLQPHRLCTWLYELAGCYHRFYESCRVLQAEDAAIRKSRLALCELTSRGLALGLNLLGIRAVERM